jgi:hypothetical protein
MLLLTYRRLGPPILLIGYTPVAAAADTNAPRAQVEVAPPPIPLGDEPTPTTMPPLKAPPLRAKSNDAFAETPPPAGRARTHPEVAVDPRTVFKQRARPSGRLEPTPTADSIPLSEGPITDMLIIPQLAGFRASEQGVKAVLGYLRSTQILVAKHQKIFADGAIGVELLPDVFSHLAFTDEGSAPAGPPCIAEGYLWFGPKAAKLPFGPARESCFRLELVGVRYPRVSPAFLARLHSILYLKAELHPVPHDPRRLRKPTTVVASEPIPLFDVQER